MRIAEQTLAAEALARRWISLPRRHEARALTVEIALNFTIGGISTAVQSAIAMMARDEPGVLIEPVWRDDDGSKDAPRADSLESLWPSAAAGIVKLSVADARGGRRAHAIPIASDRWVLACRLPAGTRKPPSAPDLAAGRLVVPALNAHLLEQAERYLGRRKIGGVQFVNDHPGELPRLIDEYADAAVFVPQSLVAPRLGLHRVWSIAADPPLESKIVAYLPKPDALTRRFIGHLQRAFADARRPKPSRPVISMRQVHYFNLVQRARRVSAAARSANITQPALSEQLGKLEAALGSPLFVRRGDGMITTKTGDRFAPAANRIEAAFRRIGSGKSSIAAIAGRRIAIGILPSVSQHGLLVNRIAEAVLEVQQRYPVLKLMVQEAPNGTLQDWVLRGLVGVAIVETSLPHVPRLPLGSSEELALVVHQKYDELPTGPVKFADLAGLPLALPTNQFGLRQLLETAAEEHGVQIAPAMEIDALTMIAAVLARTRVFTVLPPSAVRRELVQGELIAHPIVEPAIARRLFVIYSAERSLSAPERDLVNTLRERLSQPNDVE